MFVVSGPSQLNQRLLYEHIRSPLIKHTFIILKILLIYFVKELSFECTELGCFPYHRCPVLVVHQYLLGYSILRACSNFVQVLVDENGVEHPYLSVVINSINQFKCLLAYDRII